MGSSAQGAGASTAGNVYAWGDNNGYGPSGKLGDGNDGSDPSNPPLRESPRPVIVWSPPTRPWKIAAGGDHSLSIDDNNTPTDLTDDTVWAWGSNNKGQLGNNATADSPVPVKVKVTTTADLVGVKAVAAGMGFSLALKTDGTVWAWGDDSSGQLGNGSTTGNQLMAVQVQGLPTDLNNNPIPVSHIAGGGFHAVVGLNNGAAWAWGSNSQGQLGNNTITDSPSPVQVKNSTGTGNLANVSGVTAGYVHSVAVDTLGTTTDDSDNVVWSWGSHFAGQLGDGTVAMTCTEVPVRHDCYSNEYFSKLPVQVKGVGGTGVLTGVKAVAAGQHHTLALKHDGAALWSWGYNDQGQLGDTGTPIFECTVLGFLCSEGWSETPVLVDKDSTGTPLSGIKAISGGSRHSLAIYDGGTPYTTDDTALAWGSNGSSQLGNGTPCNTGGNCLSRLPGTVKAVSGTGNLEGVTAVSAGYSHSVAH